MEDSGRPMIDRDPWRRPSIQDRPRPLEATDVHVWRVALDVADPELARHRLRLSEAERERADRYRVPEPRRRYTVMRAALRTILGRYLDLDPAAVSLATGPEGKPELAAPGERRIEFNVSHSHGLGLCALARGRVGVDLEYLERSPGSPEEIARRFFSPAEYASLLELPEAERRQGFYTCWTRKEAFIKATGRGLFAALDSFDVSLAPGDPPRILAVRDPVEGAVPWSLFALEPGAGYTGALAVEGRALQLTLWSWEGLTG